jgi:hypothetical protein
MVDWKRFGNNVFRAEFMNLQASSWRTHTTIKWVTKLKVKIKLSL